MGGGASTESRKEGREHLGLKLACSGGRAGGTKQLQRDG